MGSELDRRLVALGPLSAVLRNVVHALKYRDSPRLAAVLGELLGERCRSRIEVVAPDAVVPLPTTPLRRRRRGYDQAHVLACGLGRALGLPVRALLVRSRRRAVPQTELDGAHRRLLAYDTFLLDALPPPVVILVDDVVTTGATMLSAIAAVEGAGSSAIPVCVAVTPHTPRTP